MVCRVEPCVCVSIMLWTLQPMLKRHKWNRELPFLITEAAACRHWVEIGGRKQFGSSIWSRRTLAVFCWIVLHNLATVLKLSGPLHAWSFCIGINCFFSFHCCLSLHILPFYLCVIFVKAFLYLILPFQGLSLLLQGLLLLGSRSLTCAGFLALVDAFAPWQPFRLLNRGVLVLLAASQAQSAF